MFPVALAVADVRVPRLWCTNVALRNSITTDELLWGKIGNNYEWMKYICSLSGKIGYSAECVHQWQISEKCLIKWARETSERSRA